MSFTFGTPAATPTNASLVAALDRRLGTAGAIQPVMVGAAGEGWRKSGTRAIWSDTGFAAAAKKSSVNFLRMPGGTAVDYWDWTTGQIVLDGPQPAGGEVTAGNPVPGFTLHDWLDQCVAIGAEPMIEFNVCAIPARLAGGTARFLRGSNPIPTSPYVTGAYHDDVAVLVADNMALLVEAISYMQAKGTVGGVNYSSWTPKYIELGNEIYLGGAGNPGPSASFGGRGAQYAYLAYQMALAIRTKAAWAAWAPMSVPGHIRIYACGGLASYGEKWQNDMCAWRDGAGHSVLDVVDGFTFHGMYWAQPADPTSDANAYKIINAGIAKSNSPQYVTSPVAGKTTLPAGKSAVYTEYNFMPDTGGTIAGKWVHGVAMAAATLTQIDDPAVEMTCAQAFVGPANGTYPRVVSSGGSYKLQPWGCAIALLCLASAGATKYQKISFSAGAMGSGSLAPGQGLLGAAFQTPGGTWSACIVNGDSAAYKVAFAAGSPFHGSLTGAQIATTITDTTVALPTVASMGLGSALSIPAYSVTYIQGSASTAPVVTGLDFTTGPTAGGTAVTITGSGFSAGSASVKFGANSATSVVVVSDTSITCVSPAGSAGTVDVTVTTVNGTSLTSSADQFTYGTAATPGITSIAPTAGAMAGGDTVTIAGTGFTGATGVNFGPVAAASFTVNSDSQITAVSPPQSAGAVDIRAITPAGTSARVSADHFTFTAPPSVPTVTAVSPGTAVTAGGTVLTITGTGFTGATKVTFGALDDLTFTINSDTQITITSPAHTAGTFHITVTNAAGTSAKTTADLIVYNTTPTPTVSALDVTTGPTGGGTAVTVTGTGFIAGTTVAFGANAATSVVIVSTTSITCVSPAGTAGDVDVTVTNTNGTSATNSGDIFTYTVSAVPTVTSISPNTGSTAGGTTVTVRGTGFVAGSTTVKFGATAGTSVTVASSTRLTVQTPAGHASGIFHVFVTNSAGTSTGTTADLFTFTAPGAPTVTGVSPASGLLSGGTAVTVTGTGFVAGSTTVAFGPNAATAVTVNSSTSLQCTAPAGTGTVDVVVTTGNGSSPTGPSDQYTYSSPQPVVTDLVHSSGPTGGGTSVTIDGTGFTGATAVAFGATAAASFSVVSDTQMTAVSPAGAGQVDITVTTPGGTSQTSTADLFTYTSGGLASITLSASRTVQAGDLIQIFTAWAGTSATMTTPTGFTATTMVTGTGFRMGHFWKIATSADATASAAGTLNFTLATSAATEIVAVFRADYNDDQTNPFDPAPTVSGQANASSSTIAVSSGITTSHPNGRLVAFLVTTAAAGGTPPAITLPANFVARGSGRNTTNTAGLNLAILTGDINLGTPGATGAISGTAATACINGGMAVVIKATQ